MKKTVWLIVGIVLVGLMAFKLARNKKVAENNVYHYDKEQPITVDVDTVKLKYLNKEEVFTGTFEPDKEVKLSAETQGKINTILVDVGHHVKQGQPLVLLDNSLLKLQLESIEVQLEGLQDDVNRYTILTKADAIQGVQLEKAKLGLKSAKVQKATLQEQINKTTIKAPFNGIVTAKLSEVGAFAAPGVPLLQITDLSTLKFSINVPEINLKQFYHDQDYMVWADVFPEHSLNGKLTMIGSKANIGNSFPIQFQVINTGQLDVKSGMFGKVKLSANKTQQGIIIPSSAIISNAHQTQVYLIKNGNATLQTVTASESFQDNTVISKGLTPGDVIITNGFINLFEGARVTIKN